MVGEPAPILRGIGVVLPEDVLLDLDHARLAQTRGVGVGRPLAEMQVPTDLVLGMTVVVRRH